MSSELQERFENASRFAVAIIAPTGTVIAVATVIAGLARLIASFGSFGLVETVEGDFARLRIDFEDLYLDDIAEVEHVLDFIDAAGCDAGDVQEAVLGRREPDKRAEILDADDFAFVLLAHLGFLDDAEDHALGGFACWTLDGSDMNRAVFLDIDLSTGFLLDTTHNLTAATDDVADFINRDVDGLDARRVIGKLLARRCDLFEHSREDVGTTALRLTKCASENLNGQAAGLVVHLESGDALLGTRNLEIHVAEEVLDALDIGEDDNVVSFLDEAHGDAGNRCLDRYASVHEGKCGSAG